jgi:flagellar basal-body rod protein FlgG
MVAQQLNLDTISNNLANVNTTGFKTERAEFQDLIYQTFRASGSSTGGTQVQPISLQVGLGTRFSGTGVDFSEGPVQSTNNPLNLMIQGAGFFSVLRPDGTTAYTRDGSFTTDANGNVVTSDGYPLDPNIQIPAQSTSTSISPDGQVSVVPKGANSATVIGKITVTTFSNPAGLSRVGQNLYVETGASGAPVAVVPGQDGSGNLQSGSLEGSNVQVVDEMVNMITAQRAYEINSKAITTADDLLSIVDQLKR